MLPSFICVGASKAGTTTLHDILRQHHQIFLPKIKETQFFVKEDLYSQGVKFYENKYFSDVEPSNLICGEICPQYMSSNMSAKRIYESLGAVKIIIMVRNPIERAVSHYCMKTRSFEKLKFDSAIKDVLAMKKSKEKNDQFHLNSFLEFDRFDEINQDDKNMNAYRYSRYIYPGYYHSIIQEYINYFGKENIHVVVFEDFKNNLQQEILNILKFLEVDEHVELDFTIHSNSKKLYTNNVTKKLRNLSLMIPMKYKDFLKHRSCYLKLKKTVEDILTNNGKQIEISKEVKQLLKEEYIKEVYELEKLLKVDTKWF